MYTIHMLVCLATHVCNYYWSPLSQPRLLVNVVRGGQRRKEFSQKIDPLLGASCEAHVCCRRHHSVCTEGGLRTPGQVK